jgi:DNA-directed RNA polymerase specialized sigma24 family protein
MHPTPDGSSAEDWLQGFETAQATRDRTWLGTTTGLDAADVEDILHTARWQVARHWATLTHPLAYLRTLVQHEVHRQRQRQRREQRGRAAYARQQRAAVLQAARTAAQVAAVLALAPPSQRRLLQWFAQGYSDMQVAAWLSTTPQAVRKARSEAYRVVQRQLTQGGPGTPGAPGTCPSAGAQ